MRYLLDAYQVLEVEVTPSHLIHSCIRNRIAHHNNLHPRPDEVLTAATATEADGLRAPHAAHTWQIPRASLLLSHWINHAALV